eukprot:1161773-Pelagomonas_calceolata.AAC.9
MHHRHQRAGICTCPRFSTCVVPCDMSEVNLIDLRQDATQQPGVCMLCSSSDAVLIRDVSAWECIVHMCP